MVGNFPAVLNFNRLFLELKRFIYNQLPVLPDHREGASALTAGGRGRGRGGQLLTPFFSIFVFNFRDKFCFIVGKIYKVIKI